MKKNWNKLIIIIFLAFALILSSIIVLAEENSGLKASDLAYTKQDGNTINLATALNELHDGGAGPAIPASGITGNDIGAIVKGYKTYAKSVGGTSDEWQIMYADNTNIYLITKYKTNNPTTNTTTLTAPITTNISGNYADGKAMLTNGSLNSGITKWVKTDLWTNITSSNENVKTTMYMLDERIWNGMFLDGTDDSSKGMWAIGSPTLEMLCEALEMYQYDVNHTICSQLTSGTNGYTGNPLWLKDGSLLQNEGWWNHREVYWFAAPSSHGGTAANLMIEWARGCVYNDYYGDDWTYPCGFRPVVCLKNSVKLIPNINRTAFTIKR